MHIVITRPKEDSFYLIEKLRRLGHLITHLPVIKIEKLQTKKINLENYKAVIFTSSNAIRFMNIENHWRRALQQSDIAKRSNALVPLDTQITGVKPKDEATAAFFATISSVSYNLDRLSE